MILIGERSYHIKSYRKTSLPIVAQCFCSWLYHLVIRVWEQRDEGALGYAMAALWLPASCMAALPSTVDDNDKVKEKGEEDKEAALVRC